MGEFALFRFAEKSANFQQNSRNSGKNTKSKFGARVNFDARIKVNWRLKNVETQQF